MIIEHKIKEFKVNKDIYQVGNVIENNGVYFLIGALKSQFFVFDLKQNDVYGIYDSLEELVKKFPENNDRLVNAKLVIEED